MKWGIVILRSMKKVLQHSKKQQLQDHVVMNHAPHCVSDLNLRTNVLLYTVGM